VRKSGESSSCRLGIDEDGDDIGRSTGIGACILDDFGGVLWQEPRRATYRSDPLRRMSLVRAATDGFEFSALFLVTRTCCVDGGGFCACNTR
jgi:hypothetical protein